jgi:bifunctional non-homologous end joining protein LigD
MSLQRYWKKRNFKETPEPRGTPKPSSARLQFVIQKHAASRLHYDFRLELDGTLKSWAVPKGPSLDPAQKRLAVHVEDHPMDYADFEGIIPPKQYGAGTVLLWDRGYWSPIGDAAAGYRRGRLKFHLAGKKLRGAWNLVRMGRRSGEDKENWLLIKENDEEARRGNEGDITLQSDSVASGRTMEQIAQGRHRVWHSNRSAESGTQDATGGRRVKRSSPRRDVIDPATLPGTAKASQEAWITPQLATLVDHAPEGDDWLHELKYDGYRMLCSIRNGKAGLFTRNGNDWTSKLKRIAAAAETLPVKQAWVDGEVVAVMPDGTINFQVLQNAFDVKSDTNLIYYVFDLLYLDGYDLRRVPLLDRKRALASLVNDQSAGDLIRYSDHIAGKGKIVFEEACRRGMEGMIAKRADAPYVGGRNRNWVKVKCGQRQEFVIGGFTDPSGSRVAFGALLLGVFDDQGQLRYAGRTGTGFSERSLKELHTRLTPLEERTPPFIDPPTGADARGVHWVKPILVAEVAFAEWTNEGQLRQASFQGLRDDKDARSVVHERPEKKIPAESAGGGGSRRTRRWRKRKLQGTAVRQNRHPSAEPPVVAGVTLSHPDRVLYPEQGLTKLALAQYYEQISSWILPHLEGRPLTLVRCPEGHAADCFYQKHANESVPEVIGRVKIPEGKKTGIYMVADSLEAVVGLVQLGVLEFHTWGAKRDLLDRPDRIIIDLDPDPDVPWKSVMEAAQLVRTLLNELDLECFLKTTGGKGLHVAFPLQRIHTWDEVKEFAKAIAEHLVRLIPDRFIANMSKQKRKGKIYVDYLRNAKGATAIAAYSTRARPLAPVSVPIAWSELSDDVRSDHFTVKNVSARLAGLKSDPWRDYFMIRQKLTRSMKKVLGVP